MKKTFWVFSLAMLVFSTFAPSFTYALEPDEERALEYLTNMLEEATEWLDENHWVASVVQSTNEDKSIYWFTTNNDWSTTVNYWLNEITVAWSNLNNQRYKRGQNNDDSQGRWWEWWQGPCQDWWHVPSKQEWNDLFLAWCNNSNVCDINSNSIITANDWSKFVYWNTTYGNDFITTFNFSVNDGWWYRTSTEEDEDNWVFFQFDWWRINVPSTQPKNYFYNIRCFRNNPKTVTFDANWWAFSWWAKTETHTYNYSWSEIVPIYNIQIPDRKSLNPSQQSWWMFAWWYTTAENQTVEFDISNPQTTTAYAKWTPFNDLELSEIWLTWVYIMDRNLWAKNIATWTYYWYNVWHEDNNILWYYYQRWNNYWFNNYTEYLNNSWYNYIRNTKHNSKPWWNNNYFYNNMFIKTSNPDRRDYENNINLWWWEDTKNGDENKKGPCPEWYHVPDINEWKAVINQISNNQMTICNWWTINISKCIATKLKLPFAGHRGYNQTNLVWQGRIGSYWSSNPYTTKEESTVNWTRSLYISFDENSVEINRADSRTTANSVRCFKNTNKIKELKVSKGNWEEVITNIIRWREPIKTYFLENINYEWYTFSWWYYDEDNIREVWENDLANNNTKIIAKWKKNPRYTYDANWWQLRNSESKIDYKSYEDTKTATASNIWHQNEPWEQVISFPGAKKIRLKWTFSPSRTQKIEMFNKEWGKIQTYLNWQDFTIDFTVEWDYVRIESKCDNVYPVLWYTVNATSIWLFSIDNIQETPTRSWYSFSWWYEWTTWDNNELILSGNQFDFTWTAVTQDRTLYAKWNPHHYTITFDTNEWTWVANNKDVAYWEEINLPNVTREWYIFKWWKSENWTIYTNSIPEWTWATTEDWVTVTLTAQWEKIQEATPSKWSWRAIATPTKQETKATEQEHNVADTEEQEVKTNTNTKVEVAPKIKEKVEKTKERTLTRWEIAVMTNILLEIYPKLTKNKSLNKVSEACENYADEQDFTKDEKKAITRLCKLSIMWIHNGNNKPLDEFSVNSNTTNNEFQLVVNRAIESYNEKDLSTIKEALKKLEWDDEGVVFWTVYNVFMSIKNIFN